MQWLALQKTNPHNWKAQTTTQNLTYSNWTLSNQQQMRKLSTDEKIWIIFQPFTSLKSVAPSKQFFQVSAMLDKTDQSSIC